MEINIKDLTPIEICIAMRKLNNISQSALAKTLGVSRQWVNYMENGKRSPIRLLEYWLDDYPEISKVPWA